MMPRKKETFSEKVESKLCWLLPTSSCGNTWSNPFQRYLTIKYKLQSFHWAVKRAPCYIVTRWYELCEKLGSGLKNVVLLRKELIFHERPGYKHLWEDILIQVSHGTIEWTWPIALHIVSPAIVKEIKTNKSWNLTNFALKEHSM